MVDLGQMRYMCSLRIRLLPFGSCSVVNSWRCPSYFLINGIKTVVRATRIRPPPPLLTRTLECHGFYIWFIYYSPKCCTPDFQELSCFLDVFATEPGFLRFPAKPREFSILTFHDGASSGLCLARNTWISDFWGFQKSFLQAEFMKQVSKN